MQGKSSALDLAQVELIFFIVAGMGLCFGFLLETALIMQKCFQLLLSSAYSARAFSAPQPPPPARRLGVHKRWGGGTAGTAGPS